MGVCKMEEYTIDSFELLYSGAVDKIKSHKSNLNLSKSPRPARSVASQTCALLRPDTGLF